MQIVETLIRYHILWFLICDYTVYQKPHSSLFDLGQHCLLMSLLGDTRDKQLKLETYWKTVYRYLTPIKKHRRTDTVEKILKQLHTCQLFENFMREKAWKWPFSTNFLSKALHAPKDITISIGEMFGNSLWFKEKILKIQEKMGRCS